MYLSDEFLMMNYSRLNYQYSLVQNYLGFRIHPSIAKLASDAKVADSATESGEFCSLVLLFV